MPRKAAAPPQAPATPAAYPQAPAVTPMNAAPGYDPYQRHPGAQAPADAAASYGAQPAGGNGSVYIGPPPERAPQNDFVNADNLWKYGRPVRAIIEGVRDATGTGKAEFENKRPRRSWFLDLKMEDGKPMTGRINEGDVRHQRLWAAYQSSWVGRSIILRLSNPGDIDILGGKNKATKSPWVLDCL